ncbi:hypothetical protein, partial [Rhodovulum sp. PH10]|uniref:hypothetical protein n=1 Tax=Rhodovulum sp. PH10 TaxID=1187851 RepID=UPI001ED90233
IGIAFLLASGSSRRNAASVRVSKRSLRARDLVQAEWWLFTSNSSSKPPFSHRGFGRRPDENSKTPSLLVKIPRRRRNVLPKIRSSQ